jgi:hypothetical protein
MAPAAASIDTYGTLVAASTQVVLSTILICNTSASDVMFRIGLMGTEGTPSAAAGQFVTYNATITEYDTITLSLGMTMEVGEYLRVSATSTALNFMAFLVELT